MPMVGDKTRWEVVKRKRHAPDVLDLGGRRVRLSRRGATEIRDRAVAEAINQKYGMGKTGTADVQVVPVTNNHLHDGEGLRHVHNYTFSMPSGGMPWAKYDELGRRIKETKR